MRKRDEEVPLLFKDRKKDDIISREYFSTLIQKTEKNSQDPNNHNKDSKAAKSESNVESSNDITQEHNQLNIITIPHSVIFILFISLLIGLSLNTLLSFVFPIYTESSFKDQIPDVLNIHGFKVGPAYFDGVVQESNNVKFVNIEIPSGISIDLESNSNEFSVSASGTLLFTNSRYYKNPSFLNMEAQYIQSSPLYITSNQFNFAANKLVVSNSFQIMGKIFCKSLIYKGCIFFDDGSCKKDNSRNSINLEPSIKSVKNLLQKMQTTDDFGYVKNFSINYPYIAISNNDEMRIYEYENEVQFLIGAIKGEGNLYKNLNSNGFLFGQKSYQIINNKIENLNDFNANIDYENETIDNDGNKLYVDHDEKGIYYFQCDGLNCSQKKTILLYNFSVHLKKIPKFIPFDLKISLDQYGSPVITSNSLKMAFLIDKDNNSFENINLDIIDDSVEDVRMLSYSNQLLYLSNHSLHRYLI